MVGHINANAAAATIWPLLPLPLRRSRLPPYRRRCCRGGRVHRRPQTRTGGDGSRDGRAATVGQGRENAGHWHTHLARHLHEGVAVGGSGATVAGAVDGRGRGWGTGDVETTGFDVRREPSMFDLSYIEGWCRTSKAARPMGCYYFVFFKVCVPPAFGSVQLQGVCFVEQISPPFVDQLLHPMRCAPKRALARRRSSPFPRGQVHHWGTAKSCCAWCRGIVLMDTWGSVRASCSRLVPRSAVVRQQCLGSGADSAFRCASLIRPHYLCATWSLPAIAGYLAASPPPRIHLWPTLPCSVTQLRLRRIHPCTSLPVRFALSLPPSTALNSAAPCGVDGVSPLPGQRQRVCRASRQSCAPSSRT